MEKVVYGIDIGGTTVKLGRFSEKGELLKKWEIPTRVSNQGSGILQDIAKAIKEDAALESILGIGFGVPGPVSENTVIHAVNLGWKNLNVGKTFKEYLSGDYPVYVANDANLASLGEQAFGAGKKYQNIVMFTLGTGVGGGIIQEGKIIEGARGSGGEVGHIKVPGFGFACNCGNHDCLETMASATAVKRIANHLIKTTDTPSHLRKYEKQSTKAIFSHAEKGDILALKVVNLVSESLAYACQILSLVTNPEAFVFGGGLANAEDFLIKRIENYFKGIAFPPVKNTLFLKAELGNDAGIYGGYQMVMHHD